MKIVNVPTRLTFETASKFGCDLASLEMDDDTFVFDFSRVGRVEPFGLLYISSEIQRFHSKPEVERVGVQNHMHMSYADHMGFFRSFQVEGASTNPASGSSTYIPITIKNVDRIIEQSAEKGIEIGDLIEADCEEMASILSRSNSGDLFDTLVYSFREIMRNVVEHSDAKQFGFCAQYWPKYKKVEAALLDRGRGIRSSLGQNPNLEIVSDHEALNYALMPGISGKSYKGAPKQRGFWANSGFGLYMTSRLARQGGSFFIASGEVGMYLSEEKRRHLSTPFQGVALNLSFDVSRLTELRGSLSKFREEASEISQKYKYGKNLNASVASFMLRKDFKKDA